MAGQGMGPGPGVKGYSASVTPGGIGQLTYNTEGLGREAGYIYTSSYTATAGQVNCIHLVTRYVESGNSFEVGIWTSTGTFLGSAQNTPAGASVPTMYNVALASPITLTATTYFIGMISNDATWSLYYDNTAGSGRSAVAGTLGSLTNITPPSPTAGQQYAVSLDYQEGTCGAP